MEIREHPAVAELPPSLQQKRTEVLEKCDELLAHFKRKAKEHKRAFQLFKYSSIVLTISATIISALAALQSIASWIVPIITGLAAPSTTFLTVTNAQELWVHSRTVQQQLTAEKFLFEQRAGDYAKLDEEAKVRLFAERIIDIWKRGHETWEQTTSETSTQ